MSEVRCLECSNLKLQGIELSAHGFGHCRFDDEWRFQSVAIWHECQRFNSAADDVKAARIEWFNNRLQGRKTR